MAQQSGGEFASADPTTRAQDARVQERRIGAKISLNACGGPKHLQRPASSVISSQQERTEPSGRRGIVTLTKYNRFRGRFGPIGTGASPCFCKGRSAADWLYLQVKL